MFAKQAVRNAEFPRFNRAEFYDRQSVHRRHGDEVGARFKHLRVSLRISDSSRVVLALSRS